MDLRLPRTEDGRSCSVPLGSPSALAAVGGTSLEAATWSWRGGDLSAEAQLARATIVSELRGASRGLCRTPRATVPAFSMVWNGSTHND